MRCLLRQVLSAILSFALGFSALASNPVGNRKQITSTLAPVPAGLWNYDANDRFTAGDSYDANGNTVSSGGIANVYDFENHLIQKAGVNIVYDGRGSGFVLTNPELKISNRVQKTVAGVTTKYLVDTQNPTGYAQVVFETLTGNTTQPFDSALTYVYGLELISKYRQFVANNQGQTQISYYVYDGHGSVRALTSPTGVVTDTYDYDAFGNLLHSSTTLSSPTPNNYLFAGEQFDPDLHLYYNRARYLNTTTGRFWTMDSYEGTDTDPLSLHKYLYASATPIDRVDPSGNDDIAEVSAAEGIGEELDTQVSPAQALRAEAQAKIYDIYFVFGLSNIRIFNFIPVIHSYVYENIRGINKGERFDVGVYDTSSTNVLTSLITTVPGFIQIDETDLSSVRQTSLFMKSWTSLSALEFPLWRAGIPALASELETGLQSLFPPTLPPGLSAFDIPYSVLGEGQINCLTFSVAAILAAKALEKAPI